MRDPKLSLGEIIRTKIIAKKMKHKFHNTINSPVLHDNENASNNQSLEEEQDWEETRNIISRLIQQVDLFGMPNAFSLDQGG